MHFVARSTLEDFWKKHPITEEPLKAFFKICQDASWRNPNEVVEELGESNFDTIGKHRFVIDVKGNNIRVVLIIRFTMGRIFCRWVG